MDYKVCPDFDNGKCKRSKIDCWVRFGSPCPFEDVDFDTISDIICLMQGKYNNPSPLNHPPAIKDLIDKFGVDDPCKLSKDQAREYIAWLKGG